MMLALIIVIFLIVIAAGQMAHGKDE